MQDDVPTTLEVMAGFLSARRTQVYFLQIGAMDGESFDPLHKLILQHCWHGVLVEPLPFHFSRLTKFYEGREGLFFANTAIGHDRGFSPFYYIDPATVQTHGLPPWVLGISSFYEQHILNQEVFLQKWGFSNIMQYVTRTEIGTVPLAALLEAYPLPRVDVLQIDTEGFDYQILRQWDFRSHKPAIINMEFDRLSDEDKKATTDTLLAEGYFISLQRGLDMLALQPELLHRQ